MGAALLLSSSCAGGFDEKVNDNWSEEQVWSVADIARGVLNYVYTNVQTRFDSYNNNFLDAATDNATTNLSGSLMDDLTSGAMSATNNPLDIWSTAYEQFQYLNYFLENGLADDTLYDRTDEEVDAELKLRMMGEAYFLRAYWGFRLLQVYGGKSDSGEALGYPLRMYFVEEAEAEDLESWSRDSYADCVAQIIADCDMAIVNLPTTYTGDGTVTGVTLMGRATSFAAAALRSRVALYAASPAFQSDDVVQLVSMGNFVVADDDAYTAGWIESAEVSEAAMATIGYTFYPLTASDVADATSTTPSEFLYRIYHSSREMETRHFPPYYLGNANTVPSQNLVDAFPMANGYPIGHDLAYYDETNPYVDRDKRFELNIYYHGKIFGNSGKEIDVTDDGRDSPQYNYSGSRTGYYLAKFLSKNNTILEPLTQTNAIHYVPLFRRTEIFLNLAESLNEAFGPTSRGSYENEEGVIAEFTYSAYEIIQMIREQSGGITDTGYLDEMAQSKETMRELIANERRIELAFENHRYFDLRRNLCSLTESVRGVVVSDDGDGNDLEFDTSVEVDKRAFASVKYYYAPIPYDEIVKCPNMINNLGWR